ncbi:MAG: hypothetical protein EOM20_17835, partial [Spartobacteria bacterium]|nr:hypothetical protein [Spartobacteria bacterium]
MNTPRDHRNNAVRHITIDRVLLVGILIVQLGMIAWLLTRHQMQTRDDRTSPRTPDPITQVSPDAQRHATAGRRGYSPPFPIPAQHAATQRLAMAAQSAMLRRSTIRQELDRMMRDTMHMVDHMNSLVGFDEHWDRLYASPTMDMREMDDCYEVVVSLP